MPPSRLLWAAGVLVVLALLSAQLTGGEDPTRIVGGDDVPARIAGGDEVPARAGRPPAPLPLVRPEPQRAGSKIPEQCPDREQLSDARRWAGDRSGSVGFAIQDECGKLLGEHRFRAFYAASAVKAMLMVAYLRRSEVSDRDLTESEQDQLGAMIEQSDNQAADSIFATVGESGLAELAEAAGMRNFVPSPFWGGSSITAGDQAAFLGRVERYVPRRHESFALHRLTGVIDDQRWGVADVVPKGWEIHFKGGWYPASDGWRVNQVATLRRHDRAFGLAVLTAGNPSFEYGRETVAGVARRLMEG